MQKQHGLFVNIVWRKYLYKIRLEVKSIFNFRISLQKWSFFFHFYSSLHKQQLPRTGRLPVEVLGKFWIIISVINFIYHWNNNVDLTISNSEFFQINHYCFHFLFLLVSNKWITDKIDTWKHFWNFQNVLKSREDCKFTFLDCSNIIKCILRLLFQTLFDQYVTSIVTETSDIYSLIFSVKTIKITWKFIFESRCSDFWR